MPACRRGLVAAGLVALLPACAPLAPAPSATYQCEDGREFRLTVAPAGDAAVVEIFGMTFALAAESPRGQAERYECSELGVTRTGDSAALRMGGPDAANCRRKP